MKLKFTADRKDWIMFGIYAVVLLYFVAIAVLNLAQFAAGDIDKPFHGFNPFPAFSRGFIGITLTLYVIALVASILSVSDRFFDMEKGIGFSSTKKKEEGYSKWLDEKDLKKAWGIKSVLINSETADAGGIPLLYDRKRMWVDDGEGHSLIMGASGSGKTQMIVFPYVKSLARHDESMIITDPKGEIYEGTSKMLKERGYNVVLLNFRNPQNGSGWNPLHLPYQYYKNGNKDKANELVDDLAVNILYDEAAQGQDPFWEKTSADYFSGLCLGLFADAKEEEINLNSVNMFTTVGEEKAGPNSTFVQEYFKTKDPTSPEYVSASSTLIAPNETKGSILSVFKQKLRLFASRENMSEMLSHSDFDFEDIGSRKTAIFIVIQDEKTTYHPLVTIFVKQCYEALVDYAQKSGGKLPYRTNFILDEFANMPPLKDVETMVSAARSRNMRFTFIIQNFAQLSDVYGKEKGETIRGNCTNLIYLISTELAALKEISEMCGNIKKKTGKGDKEKEETVPLVTVSDLQKMPRGEIILIRQRLDPFRTKLKFDHEMDWPPLFMNQSSKDAVYPSREKEEIKVFDLKGFVNKKKEERIQDLISNNMGKGMPSIPGLPNIPGMPSPSRGNSPQRRPGGLNVDELVKRIDQRLAAIEEEEKMEKKKLEVRAKGGNVSEGAIPKKVKTEAALPNEIKETDDNNDESSSVTSNKVIKEEDSNKSDSKTEIIVPAKPTNKHVISKKDLANKVTDKVNEKAKNINTEDKKNRVSDDQFFDDFFADDE